MNSFTDPQYQSNDSASFARGALRAVPVAVRPGVVNRTHRVVRERAKIMQEKRSRDRSLMLPLIICSVLLLLCVIAVWFGFYQYQAVEVDVAALAVSDATNHALVALLWFVPVSLALMITIWVRRSRNNAEDEAL